MGRGREKSFYDILNGFAIGWVGKFANFLVF